MNYEYAIRIGFYVFSAAAVIFLAEALFAMLAGPLSRKRSINRRLRTLDDGVAGEQALLRIKAERGIMDRDLELMGWLTRLLVQSGLRLTTFRFVLMLAAIFGALWAGLSILTALPAYIVLPVAAFLAGTLPLQVIRIIRSKRQAEFTSQLPDALDVVVRSLRSGHPIPTAMGLVGREMPDPVGTEFGLTIDEMTYGLEMPKALQNLGDRVGVADVSLLVTAVALQSKSGGNLSEVLDNLSKVLRSRFELRRKVRSISAEGRFSAYGLTAMPVLIFLAIFLQNPKYYTDVWDQPVYQMTMAGLVVWSFLGDYMMYKMINFKF